MELRDIIWGPHFERIAPRRSKCLLCGLELDHAGGRPQRHLLMEHPDTLPPEDVSDDATAPPEDLKVEPEEAEAPSPIEVREKTLGLMHTLLADPSIPANARVGAGRLISEIERLQELGPEEDEDETEAKVVDRYRKALQKKPDLEEEFRMQLRDPAVLTVVERLCAEVRATL